MERNLQVCKSRDCCIDIIFPGEEQTRYRCMRDKESNVVGGTYSFPERYIKSSVPDSCPYYLEHFMLNSYL